MLATCFLIRRVAHILSHSSDWQQLHIICWNAELHGMQAEVICLHFRKPSEECFFRKFPSHKVYDRYEYIDEMPEKVVSCSSAFSPPHLSKCGMGNKKIR